jgi:hypothetical protein
MSCSSFEKGILVRNLPSIVFWDLHRYYRCLRLRKMDIIQVFWLKNTFNMRLYNQDTFLLLLIFVYYYYYYYYYYYFKVFLLGKSIK